MLCCCAQPAGAALLVYEPFDYSAGALQGQVNGNGETWERAGTANPPNAINVVSGNLSVPAPLPGATGGMLQITGNGNGSGSTNRLGLGSGITTATPITADASVYYSLALRVDALTGSNNTVGGFVVGLNNTAGAQSSNPSAVAARLQMRIDPSDATKYNLGIFNNRSAAASSTSWTGPLNVGDTYFLVAQDELISGTSNDVSRLWVNPAISATPPTATVEDTTGATTDINVASIIVRQSPAPFLTMDELRVGTSWGDVVGVPEPAGASLLLVGAALAGRRRRRNAK
jgi:hypothetical protein